MATKRKLKLKIHKATNGQYYSTIIGTNGQVLFTSETYATKKGCLKTCKRVLALEFDSVIEEIKKH